MQYCRYSLSALIASFFLATSAAVSYGAVVQNGSFENGLTGWTVVGGDAGTVGTAFGITPTEGANQGSLNNAGVAAASDTAIEMALNLAAGRLDLFASQASPGAGAFNGTAIFQSIAGVLAGEQLSFDWSFVTNEDVTAPFNQNDFAFWSITNMANPGTILHRAADPLQPASEGFAFKSAPGRVTYNFTAAGDYLLGFGVINVNSSARASGLLIDNVAVPEPTSLGLLSLIASGWLVHRRHRKSPSARLQN